MLGWKAAYVREAAADRKHPHYAHSRRIIRKCRRVGMPLHHFCRKLEKLGYENT
jgi:hypothetical protein